MIGDAPVVPNKPPHFNRRDARQVFFLRLRDWMWPTAIAIAVAIVLLSRSSGPYHIGSVTYLANMYGPPLILIATVFAGVRWCAIGWCWMGAPSDHDPSRCDYCDYSLVGLDGIRDSKRCPECGSELAGPPTRRRIPIARMLLDLPGLLTVLAAFALVAVVMLALVGVVEFD